MADEGIMAVPQGMGMQDEEARPPRPTVTSADSYDAAQTALGMVNPQEQAALKEAIRQNIGDLQVTPQQLDVLIQVLEYVSQNPGDYKNLLQMMVERGALEKGDMPPEYDPEFIGAMLAVLQEMRQMQGAGAQEPMDLSPVVEGLQPVGMASGGLADVGQYLASKGRGGDRILAHITPKEAALLKRKGGAGTINPATGLPEFKDDPFTSVFKAVGNVFKGVADVAKTILKSPVGKILGTIALATVLGPAGIGLTMSSATAAGLAGAGTTLLGGGDFKEALISGAMGYIGGGGTVMGVNPISAVGSYLPGAAGGLLNTGLATGVIGAGIGKLGGMSTEDALKMGLTSGVSAAALSGLKDTPFGRSMKEKALADQTFQREAFSSAAPTTAGIGDARSMLASTSAPGGSMPADYQADFYKQIGIDPRSMSSTSVGASPSNIQIERGYLGMTGLEDTARQLIKEPVNVAKDIYNTNLSPSRPGLPADAGLFRKYGPLAAAGTATIAAFGGMDSSPAEIDEMTAGERARYIESRRRAQERRDFMEKGGYGLEKPVLNTPYNPIVSPSYDVPLFYGPDGQPRRMAQGGIIGRFQEGGDAGYEERRRRAQERQDFLESGGHGLEGNVFDPSQKRVLYQAPVPKEVRLRNESVGERHGGEGYANDAPEPGTGNKGTGQTGYGILGSLAGGANLLGLTGLGGLLASGIPVGAAYKDGSYTIADLAALGNKSAIAGLAEEAALAPARAEDNAATIAGFGFDPGSADAGSARGGDGDGGGGARGDGGATGGGYMAKGGPAKMTQFPRRNGPINGRGTGTSDDIPAMLSDGEFVFTAKAVRNAGGGSRRKGAARMYKLMKKLEGGAVKGQ